MEALDIVGCGRSGSGSGPCHVPSTSRPLTPAATQPPRKKTDAGAVAVAVGSVLAGTVNGSQGETR